MHAPAAATVGDCAANIEALLFEAEDLEVTARLAKFERLFSEMTRERKLALVARLERLLRQRSGNTVRDNMRTCGVGA